MDTNETTESATQGGESTTAAPTDTPTSGGTAAKLFTQEEVSRIAAEAREQGRKSATKTQPAMPASVPTPQTAAVDETERVTLKQLREQLEEVKMRGAFDKRASRRGLTDEVSDELFEIFKAQRPADPDAWFEKKSALFGFRPASGQSPAAPTAQPATTATASAQSSGQPISDKGSPAPGGTVMWQRELAEKPFAMSPAARAQMDAEHGPDKARRMRVEAAQAMGDRIRVVVTPQR